MRRAHRTKSLIKLEDGHYSLVAYWSIQALPSPISHLPTLRILYSMACWNPAYGGPFFSVGALSRAIAATGTQACVVAGEHPRMPAERPPDGVELHTLSGCRIPLVGQLFIPRLRTRLDALSNTIQPDIIHENGLWLSLNREIAHLASKKSIPRMLSPRGTLDPWSLEYRAWKKKLALTLYQRGALERVDCFHAASLQEAQHIRNLGLKQPIAVIPNGIDFPELPAHFMTRDRGDTRVEGQDESGIPRSDLRTSTFQLSAVALAKEELPAKRTALYLGRIHPIKNLVNLLHAWSEVRPEDWCLKLVGSNESGHRQELEALAHRLDITDQLVFSGPKYGQEKAELLRDSQLLCLVSKSENFGITAAEAMAAGLPVLTSKETPWECAESSGAGWWVEGRVTELGRALDLATKSSPEQLRSMGAKGRVYAEQHFSWAHICVEFQAVYAWLSGGGQVPPSIQL